MPHQVTLRSQQSAETCQHIGRAGGADGEPACLPACLVGRPGARWGLQEAAREAEVLVLLRALRVTSGEAHVEKKSTFQVRCGTVRIACTALPELQY